jgi:hypothetical protein
MVFYACERVWTVASTCVEGVRIGFQRVFIEYGELKNKEKTIVQPTSSSLCTFRAPNLLFRTFMEGLLFQELWNSTPA